LLRSFGAIGAMDMEDDGGGLRTRSFFIICHHVDLYSDGGVPKWPSGIWPHGFGLKRGILSRAVSGFRTMDQSQARAGP
jgi:hypothetical protein